MNTLEKRMNSNSTRECQWVYFIFNVFNNDASHHIIANFKRRISDYSNFKTEWINEDTYSMRLFFLSITFVEDGLRKNEDENGFIMQKNLSFLLLQWLPFSPARLNTSKTLLWMAIDELDVSKSTLFPSNYFGRTLSFYSSSSHYRDKEE